MNFRKKFLVKPGRKFKLADIDPDFHGQHVRSGCQAGAR